MSEVPRRLVIATRASPLALWQAKHVQAQLRALYPGCEVDLLELSTRGDRILDRSLSKIGGKGLFIKELETALLDGRADLAVHSLKDVPVDLTDPFKLAVVMQRADSRDAFVSNDWEGLGQLPEGSVVGTSSLRRESQVRARYPNLQIRPLRGNVNTRLSKLDAGEFSAIILAAAGLQRLGLQGRIRTLLEPEEMLPAAGQGALGIEILSSRSQLADWLAPLSCSQTEACVRAERSVSRLLGGSCQVPLAAYARLHNGRLMLEALVAEPDGRLVLRARAEGEATEAESLGQGVAQSLLSQGARAIIERLQPSALG